METTAIESVLKRDRAIVLASLAAITALAWLYLVRTGNSPEMGGMAGMPDMAGPEFPLIFAMWAVMMVGMMVAPAAPMILLFAAVNRKRRALAGPYIPTAAFVSGYLLVWTGASLIAAGAQWELAKAALLSPKLAAISPEVSGAILVLAGVYQWTPLKHACLRHCRTPLDFVMFHWREGIMGALRMGAVHGFYCLGCCWMLMALLFAGGIMNLAVVAAIAVFVLAEKVAPFGPWIARASGAALTGAGLYLILEPLLA